MRTQIFHIRPAESDETSLSALSRVSELPKTRLKDAMAKGAVWLKRGKSTKRLRRSTAELRKGDELTLYYNQDILALKAPEPLLLADEKHYSVWNKPAGLLAQGSREGDHCSLLRIAEQQLGREVYLVHRLDREASGLMLIAHNNKAAAALSALFAQQDETALIRKIYQVTVKGVLPEQGSFTAVLDGKSAHTLYTRELMNNDTQTSSARVELITGRKHQIRRHFAEAGFGVMGDPLYGSNNKNSEGLQLKAVSLEFVCPITKIKRLYQLPLNNNTDASS